MKISGKLKYVACQKKASKVLLQGLWSPAGAAQGTGGRGVLLVQIAGKLKYVACQKKASQVVLHGLWSPAGASKYLQHRHPTEWKM